MVTKPPFGMGSMNASCDGPGARDVGREEGAGVAMGDPCCGVPMGVVGARPLPLPPRVLLPLVPRITPVPLPLPRVGA